MKEIIIIIFLILLNGIFAISEIALITARKSSLTHDAKNGNIGAKRALKLANNPDIFLSTIQIGITLVGILTGIYSGDLLAVRFSELLTELGFPAHLSHPVAQTAIIIVVTYLSLIFGELVPKRIGMNIAEKAAKTLATPMLFLSVITKPFVLFLAGSTNLILSILGIKNSKANVTEDEIRSIIQEGKEDGVVQPMEQDILERVFLLGDLKVSSIMTNRSEIIGMEINSTREEIYSILENEVHEIYPVYEESLDNITGVISLRNLVLNLHKPGFKIESIIQPPFSFHENMNVYKALEKMKEYGDTHALVFDEFGVCQGIVTSKDILEVLVGLESNPCDTPEIIKRTDGDGWLADGQCQFYDFLIFFDMEDSYKDEGFNTLGGLIITRLEHIPKEGEAVSWKNFRFEVVDMDGARIDKVLITRTGNNN